jgi:hypothetical protein
MWVEQYFYGFFAARTNNRFHLFVKGLNASTKKKLGPHLEILSSPENHFLF